MILDLVVIAIGLGLVACLLSGRNERPALGALLLALAAELFVGGVKP